METFGTDTPPAGGSRGIDLGAMRPAPQALVYGSSVAVVSQIPTAAVADWPGGSTTVVPADISAAATSLTAVRNTGGAAVEAVRYTATGTQDRLAGLDSYRGVAALLVLVFHAYQFSREGTHASRYLYEGTPVHLVLHSLDVMVAWFFVLSGFLLFLPVVRAVLAGEQPRTARTFLLRRARRIVPAYYLAIVLVWGARYAGQRENWVDLAEHLTFTHVFDRAHIFWTIGPAWSLGDEMLFALLLGSLLPLLGWASVRLQSRALRGALVVVLPSALVLGSLGYTWWAHAIAGVPADDFSVYFGPLVQLDSFAIGMLVASLMGLSGMRRDQAGRAGGRASGCADGLSVGGAPVRHRVRTGAAAALVVVGLGAHVPLFVYRSTFPLVEWYMFPLAASAFALILAGTVLAPPTTRWLGWLAWRPLAGLGLVSYSLYLWHEPLMLALAQRHLLLDPSPEAFPSNAVALTLCTLAVAIVSYWLMEAPFLGQRIAAPRRQAIPTPAR